MMHKTTLLLIGMALLTGSAIAQTKPQTVEAQRKFRFFAINESDSARMATYNYAVNEQLKSNNRSRGLIGDFTQTLLNSFGGQAVSKVSEASTSLIGLGLDWVVRQIKGERDRWYATAQQHCTYHNVVSAETAIQDFYATPSTRGALDPTNMRFEGFGCQHYIEATEQQGCGQEAFYFFCRLRRSPDDIEGINSIVNHGKFLVAMEKFQYRPLYSNVPNDSVGDPDYRFSFDRRSNLMVSIKVKFYSSWLNEAIILNNDQFLGEFQISARIDPKFVRDGVFEFDPDDPEMKGLVTVDGECLMVPRSFTGTTDAQNYSPTWGTGQYRMEMEIAETCTINDAYYRKQDGNKGKVKWDDAKWKPEWKMMQQAPERRRNAKNLESVMRSIKAEYEDNKWIAVITEPITTSLVATEVQVLNDMLGLEQEETAEASSPAAVKAKK